MPLRTIRELAPGYTSEVDSVDEQVWCQTLDQFEDANVYQTWAYASVLCGRRNMRHLILRRNGEIAAIAQARIAQLPILNLGIAYIQWGPLWQRRAEQTDAETFRQAIRALRNEFVCRRGLALRLFPIVFCDDLSQFMSILTDEGFSPLGTETQGRTILMDVTPTIDDLREGMRAHWKRELKVGERNRLEVLEGTSDELFEKFIVMYREMVARKKFAEPNDINQFSRIQSQLPERFKMKVMLCGAGGKISAGLICSIMGNTAIYLFGATSNDGLKSRGSYLLQWKLIDELKRKGVTTYNLNGINPEKNPGTYKFKSDFAGTNGRDVRYVGRLDTYPSMVSRSCVEFGGQLRVAYRMLKERFKKAKVSRPESEPVKELDQEMKKPALGNVRGSSSI
jgi:hypothetical protein